MTLHLTAEDVRALATEEVALAAAREAVHAEADGEASTPTRLDMPTPNGFLRFMPGRFRGIAGVKTMSMTRGVGNRYLLTVYDLADGNVLALIDADEVTRLRTAATTAVAAEAMLGAGKPTSLGLIGTGFEATGHLRVLARRYPLSEVRVFSRSPERCARFAATMTDELGISVVPTHNPEEAVRGMPLVCLATKDTAPVVDGSAILSGAVVLSIGSTRPDLRELDDAAFKRSSLVLVDSVHGVIAESGDVQSALAGGAIDEADLISMAHTTDVATAGRRPGDLKVFKSVGTALQDLALAASIISAASASEHGRELGELAQLKPSAGASRPLAAAGAIKNGNRP